jgi:hypothetical protein
MESDTLLVWERVVGCMEIGCNYSVGYLGRRSSDDFLRLVSLMAVNREMRELVIDKFCAENVWTRNLSCLFVFSEGWLQSCRQWELRNAMLLPVKTLQTVPFYRDNSISQSRGNHYPVLKSVDMLLETTGGLRALLRRMAAKRKRVVAKALRPPKPRKPRARKQKR